MSPNATRTAALLAACLAAATTACAPDYRADCSGPETVAVDYGEQVCFAGPEGYEACRWVRKTHVATIPAICEASVTIHVTPLVRR